MYDENLEHLFSKYREVTQLWDNVQQWINNKLRVNLVLTNLMKLHGYLINDQKFCPLNLTVKTSICPFAINVFNHHPLILISITDNNA